MSIVDPFNMHFEYFSQIRSDGVQKKLFLEIEDILARLAYEDLRLLLHIYQNLPQEATLELDDIETQEKVSQKIVKVITPITMNSSQINIMVKEGYLILVDNCSGNSVPLFEFQTTNFKLYAISQNDVNKAVIDSLLISTNFYNRYLSCWEPLQNKWRFSADIRHSVEPKSLVISVNSKEPLNLTISSKLLGTLDTTIKKWKNDYEKEEQIRRKEFSPYELRNLSGVPLSFTSADMSFEEFVGVGDSKEFKFDGNKQRSSVRDEKTATNPNHSITIKFSDGYFLGRSIQVDQVGKSKFERIREKSLLPSFAVIELEIDQQTYKKIVTVTSYCAIMNHTNRPITFGVKQNGVEVEFPRVNPGEKKNIPLCFNEDCFMKIKPESPKIKKKWSEFFQIFQQKLRNVTCHPEFQNQGPYHHLVKVERTDTEIIAHICPQFSIENSLPCAFEYRIFSKNEMRYTSNLVQMGETSPIYTFLQDDTLTLEIKLQLPELYKWSEKIDLFTEIKEDIEIQHGDESRVLIRMRYLSDHLTSKVVSIFARFVLYNQTGLKLDVKNGIVLADPGTKTRIDSETPTPIILQEKYFKEALMAINKRDKDEQILGMKDICPNHTFEELAYNFKCTKSYEATIENSVNNRIGQVPFGLNGTYPTILNFGKDGGKKVIQFKISGINSSWSQEINVGVPNEGIVNINCKKGVVMPFSVSISQKGDKKKGSHTKFIYIRPLYKLVNCLDFPIELTDSWTSNLLKIPESSQLFVYLQKHGQETEENRFRIRIPKESWSNYFSVSEYGEFHARLDEPKSTKFADVNIFLEKGHQLIVFKKGEPPFKIKNCTKSTFLVRQVGENSFLRVPPESTIVFDLPKNVYEIEMTVEGNRMDCNMCKYDIRTIGQKSRYNYVLPEKNDGTNIYRYAISVIGEGPTRIVQIENCVTEKPLVIETQKELELKLNLSFVGISVFDSQPVEISYITLDGVDLEYWSNSLANHLSLTLKDLQIDNQLKRAKWPCAFFREKNDDSADIPFLRFSLDQSFINKTIDVIPSAQISVQEFYFKMDEEFFLRWMSFFNLEETTEENNPIYSENKNNRRIYIQLLILNPVEAHISFTSRRFKQTNLQSNVKSKQSIENTERFFKSVFGKVITNIDDATFKLNALILENLFTSRELFTSLIVQHFKQQALGQAIRIVGSSDVLGNPSGLFRNITTGVRDFFVEPAKGLVLGQEELVAGLGKGTSSLIQNTFLGVMDSASKITRTAMKGMSKVTFDNEFQASKQRESNAESLGEGISKGFEGLGNGLLEGISGVISQPIEGGQQQGVSGFLKGIGIGLVGAVTKPAIGVLDLTYNVATGAKNQIKKKDPQRKRPPHFIPRNGRITTYNEEEAQAYLAFCVFLQEKYSSRVEEEEFISYSLLSESSTSKKISIVTTYRILELELDKLREYRIISVNVNVPFEEIARVYRKDGSIVIETQRDEIREIKTLRSDMLLDLLESVSESLALFRQKKKISSF